MKKVLSVLLTVAMLLSLCVPAFADFADDEFNYPTEKFPTEKIEKRPYDYYFCIGDSIAAGCIVSGGEDIYPEKDFIESHNEKFYTLQDFRFVWQSYPWYIMQALDYVDPQTGVAQDQHFVDSHGFNAAHACTRVAEMLLFLTKDEKYADGFTYNMYNDWMCYHNVWNEDGEEQFLLQHEYNDDLAKADLITINLGSNDLINTLVYHLLDLLDSEENSEYSETFDAAIEKAKTMPFASDVLVYLLSTAKDAYESIDQFLDLLLKLATAVEENGLMEFYRNWDTLMEYIYTNGREDADIVVIGMYNVFETILDQYGSLLGELGISEEVGDFIIQLGQRLVDLVNYKMQYGSVYSSRYTYFDSSFMPAVMKGGNVDSMGVHPSREAHKIYAEHLIECINNICHHENTYTLFKVRPSIAHAGYSGDEFCADCGKLVKEGSVITSLGQSIKIPSSLGYKLVGKIITAMVSNISAIFKNLPVLR